MDLFKLRQQYKNELIRVGVCPNRAKKVATELSFEELRLISDIWPDFNNIFKLQDKPKHKLQIKNLPQNSHPSILSIGKRCLDVLGAIVGLLITAIIFIPVAVAIKIDSPGPILYSQIRCGLNGKPFRMWKFRTMIKGADKQKHLVENESQGYMFKNKNDWRITRVGRFLRSHSLDEFPQFWNVLKDEMSLVGTRPPTPDEVQEYQPYHYRRLLVKPGITGEWQTNGRSNIKDFEDIVKMDLDYQKKWSLSYDLKLILKTINLIFQKTGAH